MVKDNCEAYSDEACRAAGENLGLGIGNDFIGNYSTKGCFAFTNKSPNFAGKIYFSHGATKDDFKATLSDHKFRPLGYDCISNIPFITKYIV